jgi:hypothetical protein
LAAIHSFPNSTGDRSKVEKVRFIGHTGDSQSTAPSERADQSPFETGVEALIELGRGLFVSD